MTRLNRFFAPIGVWLLGWLKRIPLIGPMFACSIKEHLLALKDFLITVSFSTMTFWFSALILSALQQNEGIAYNILLASTVQGGELFIFSVGILGPMLITVTDDTRQGKNFPSATWLIFVLVIAALVCGGYFALMKTTAAGLAGLAINKDHVLTVSFWAAGISCLLRYLTIAYNKSLARLNPEDLQAGEQEFKNAFAARHGKGS